jgi:hypothetical protein
VLARWSNSMKLRPFIPNSSLQILYRDPWWWKLMLVDYLTSTLHRVHLPPLEQSYDWIDGERGGLRVISRFCTLCHRSMTPWWRLWRNTPAMDGTRSTSL